MIEDSIIQTLYLAQREIFFTYKNAQDTKNAFQKVCECEHELYAAIENDEKLVGLYNALDAAQSDHAWRAESDCYFLGFQSGFKLAKELETKMSSDNAR